MKNYNFTKAQLNRMNNEVSSEIFQKIYKNTTYHLHSNNKGLFEDSMQKLITRIGMIVKNFVGYNKSVSTNESAISCIAFALGDNSVYHYWKGTEVNTKGNFARHREKYEFDSSEFKETVHQYNRIIEKLCNAGFTCFSNIYIRLNSKKNSELAQDCLAEKYSVKHFMLGENRIKLLLSPSYTYDKYTKKISTKLTMFWEESTNDKVSVRISNSKNGKKLIHETLTLGDNTKKSFSLDFDGDDLINSLAKVDMSIQLKRKEFRAFTRQVPVVVGKFKKKTIMTDEEYTQLVEYVYAEEKCTLSNTLDKCYNR